MTVNFPDWENPHWYSLHHENWMRRGRSLDVFYESAWEALPGLSSEHRALDVGSATGRFAAGLVERFPRCGSVVLCDIRGERLDLAVRHVRSTGFEGEVTRLDQGFSAIQQSGDYDVVSAMLALREFAAELPSPVGEPTSASLPAMLNQLRQRLRPGGFLIWGEVVGHVESPLQLQTQTDLLHAWDALGWLNDAGFDRVECIFRHQELAVFRGRNGASDQGFGSSTT